MENLYVFPKSVQSSHIIGCLDDFSSTKFSEKSYCKYK
jgi:hypothetical protein